MRLDRTAFKAYNFKTQSTELDNYKNLSSDKKAEVFHYLQSVVYNFEIFNYPKMDKTIHSSRKNG